MRNSTLGKEVQQKDSNSGKIQTEILEMKSSGSQIKSSMEHITSKLNWTEERISEIRDKVEEL
jgi:peptidoglycan hydrolase CwlO-like protein